MIVTASFKMDSPNIKAKRFLSQFISLNIDNTVTGSVELINAPNATLALSPKSYYLIIISSLTY